MGTSTTDVYRILFLSDLHFILKLNFSSFFLPTVFIFILLEIIGKVFENCSLPSNLLCYLLNDVKLLNVISRNLRKLLAFPP
jgi:hypothetical protein